MERGSTRFQSKPNSSERTNQETRQTDKQEEEKEGSKIIKDGSSKASETPCDLQTNRWIFLQSTDAVFVPLLSIRNVNAGSMTLFG